MQESIKYLYQRRLNEKLREELKEEHIIKYKYNKYNKEYL